jgi:very-long-chain ceramide synthase
LKLLLIVVVLYTNWEILAPYVAKGLSNPFAPLLFISHRVPESSPDDPRYQKGYLDLVFIAYYIIFWSFVRQTITLYICRPIARWFGIKKEAKLDRFGEQAYAVLYFGFTGFWGLVRIRSLLLSRC